MKIFQIILLLTIKFTFSQITSRRKCLYWKNKLRVSCGFIFNNLETPQNSFAKVDWYYSNRKIFESFDILCPWNEETETGCNLGNELFLLEKNHEYYFKYSDGKIVFRDLTDDDLLESEQEFESCFLCILDLYKTRPN